MTSRFQDKYRINSARLQNWNYGRNGIYFVTICIAGHDSYFGVMENKKMVLSEIGKTAQSLWLEIPNHFTYIQLHAYVIMPNHLHGIIAIHKRDNSNDLLDKTPAYLNMPNDKIIVESGMADEFGVIDGIGIDCETGGIDETEGIVETRLIASLRPTSKTLQSNIQHQQPISNNQQPVIPSPPANPNSIKINGGFTRDKNPMLNDNLSRIMRWYKGRTTFEARKIYPGFTWQPRFYDHVIRNKADYKRIVNYIDNNPANWEVDKYY